MLKLLLLLFFFCCFLEGGGRGRYDREGATFGGPFLSDFYGIDLAAIKLNSNSPGGSM